MSALISVKYWVTPSFSNRRVEMRPQTITGSPLRTVPSTAVASPFQQTTLTPNSSPSTHS